MLVKKSQWVGAEGAAFERVGLAFEALGYQPPRADDGSGGAGAYVSNIITQYQSDLSEAQVMSIVGFALARTRQTLERYKRDAGTPDRLRLSDVL